MPSTTLDMGGKVLHMLSEDNMKKWVSSQATNEDSQKVSPPHISCNFPVH